MKTALQESDQLAVVYPSPWYWNPKERSLYSEHSVLFHEKAVNHFGAALKDKLGLNLHVLKSKDPDKKIEAFCMNEGVDTIYYDAPLFKKDYIEFSFSNTVVIDSDTYMPECTKMTAKSRWTHWVKNRTFIKNTRNIKTNAFDVPFSGLKINTLEAEEMDAEIHRVWQRVEDKIVGYHLSRNERDGSTKISKYLHHGLIDGPTLVSDILSLCPSFLPNKHPLVPLLRQMAFREISIRKARIKDLSLTSSCDEWARTLLDEKSYRNLVDIECPQQFSKRQILEGRTGHKKLDEEIKLCIQERWMPNRARMWFAGEVYWGMGGGIKSLEALVEFFNKYCDDAQSPNNWVSCVESMRMQYGKVMRFNEKRTFKLLSGQERI